MRSTATTKDARNIKARGGAGRNLAELLIPCGAVLPGLLHEAEADVRGVWEPVPLLKLLDLHIPARGEDAGTKSEGSEREVRRKSGRSQKEVRKVRPIVYQKVRVEGRGKGRRGDRRGGGGKSRREGVHAPVGHAVGGRVGGGGGTSSGTSHPQTSAARAPGSANDAPRSSRS